MSEMVSGLGLGWDTCNVFVTFFTLITFNFVASCLFADYL